MWDVTEKAVWLEIYTFVVIRTDVEDSVEPNSFICSAYTLQLCIIFILVLERCLTMPCK